MVALVPTVGAAVVVVVVVMVAVVAGVAVVVLNHPCNYCATPPLLTHAGFLHKYL